MIKGRRKPHDSLSTILPPCMYLMKESSTLGFSKLKNIYWHTDPETTIRLVLKTWGSPAFHSGIPTSLLHERLIHSTHSIFWWHNEPIFWATLATKRAIDWQHWLESLRLLKLMEFHVTSMEKWCAFVLATVSLEYHYY